MGLPDEPNLKAEMGTCVHKTLEVLAKAKKQLDGCNTRFTSIVDDKIGEIDIDRESFLKPYVVTEKQRAFFNKVRANKQVYKNPCFVETGHTQFGVRLVKEIFEKSYDYYSKKSPNTWTSFTKIDIEQWIWIALDYKNGLHDPRRLNIFETEKNFDFVIDKPWAKYKFGDIRGNLALKGTIDLLLKPTPTSLGVTDYKTGQRKDWTTGKVKTLEYLQEDPQLLFYHYALLNLYPEYDETYITIFFIRDGGPFTLHFTREDFYKAETKIKDRFEEIKANKVPQPLDITQKDFRCNRLCSFYKNKFEGESDNMCHTLHREIEVFGLDYVTQHRKQDGHNIDFYSNPGE